MKRLTPRLHGGAWSQPAGAWRRPISRLRGNGGMLSMVELIIAMVITVIMAVAVAETMVGTARAYVAVADQSLTQGNAKWAMDRMKEEIVQAFPIFASSDDDSILFTKHGENLDALDPTDKGEDTVCYRHVPPSPAPSGGPDDKSYLSNYQPGSIWRGVNTGRDPMDPTGGSCAWQDDYRRITDNMTDIRAMKFEYCVPTGTTVGEYDCTAAADEPCVWQIIVTLTVARRFHPPGSGLFNVNTEESSYQMQSTVRPRNIYIACFDSVDLDNDGFADALEGTWAEDI